MRSVVGRLMKLEHAILPPRQVHVLQVPAGLSEAEAGCWQSERGRSYPERDLVVFIRLFGVSGDLTT